MGGSLVRLLAGQPASHHEPSHPKQTKPNPAHYPVSAQLTIHLLPRFTRNALIAESGFHSFAEASTVLSFQAGRSACFLKILNPITEVVKFSIDLI